MSESNDKNESELPTEALTPVENEQSEFVKLNVGGFLFQTTMATLTKVDCMFKGMFSEGFEAQKDPEGWILIDRDGKHFGKILEFLRNTEITLPDNVKEIRELLTEAIYYSIERLTVLCESELRICRERKKSALITSSNESSSFIIRNSFKPVVKLYISQTNLLDKCNSFTAITNLYRNVDLFDKLCSNTNGRIVYIKNLSKDDTQCNWTFYEHHGKQIDYIDCITSTPPSAITVSFSEGQIYEKVLRLVVNGK
ncbi:BTB/POZ domain-containing adapter for CUL3-mediated RhoA degradation protein 3-like [Panonychus citri]|uniref:BTB/POZ domain-containing adapter for CUL3-mediated RhoA degradation protein 3-like n=1 Tax=Panonychus citri TaxID=50023 RepID=UPI002307DA2C|nr:BTB/POZ domain-containing adapter for CUL3-mediated RhoA degradation protein 3-like [Panonychus citri]